MLRTNRDSAMQNGPRRWWNTDPALTTTMGEHRMADTPLKHCSKCALDKPRTEFRADKQKSDGLYSSCRDCCRAKERARYASDPTFRKWCIEYRYRNPEVARNNEVRQRTVNREALLERKRDYQRRASARPEIQEKWAEYRKQNAAQIEARRQKWRQDNPERVRELSRGYTHLRRSRCDGGMTAPELAEWMKAQPKVCHWCGCKCAKGFHVDHYVPLSKGGAHEAHNLVIACKPCNLRKNAKDPLAFAREVGRLL